MAVDERRRVELFAELVAAHGEEVATTMLELLPPPGLDVATTQDIARLERRIDGLEARFDRLEERFGGLEEQFGGLEGQMTGMEHRLSAAFERRINEAITAQTRTIIFGLLGALVVLGGYALSLARLVG